MSTTVTYGAALPLATEGGTLADDCVPAVLNRNDFPESP